MKKRNMISITAIALSLLLAGCGGGGGGASGGSAGGDAPTATAEKVNWKMACCWGDGTGMYETDQTFCDYVSQLTGGNFTITTYPAGQLCDATGVLEFVQSGAAECGGDWAGYWTGYNTAFDLLGSNMYNFCNYDYYMWIYQGGGLELYNEIYGQYGLRYFPHAISAMESGIRSSKPIQSLSDLQGMKIRFSGLSQGLIASKLNMAPVSISVSELYESLQRGVIDATEYSIPSNDYLMNLQEVCGYWLTPGWHQTSSVYGCMVNQAAYDKLPVEYQQALDLAARLTNQDRTGTMQYMDAEATQAFLDYGVVTTSLSDEEMETIYNAYREVVAGLCAENPDYQKVWDSMMAYREFFGDYRDTQGQWGFGFNLED